MKFITAFFCWLIICNSAFGQTVEIKIAVSGFSGIQREAFLTLADDFHLQHPDISVKFVLTEDKIFKDRLNDWLKQHGELDLVVWHGGERLKEIAKPGFVKSLSEIWEKGHFDDYFSSAMQKASSLNNIPYGIPISTYQWGFYYNRQIFDRHNIQEPATWDEFLEVLTTLKAQGIVPITLASGSGWPIVGWYEYLNLRLNGDEAQLRLNDITLDINEKEVTRVLNKLKELVEQETFVKHHRMISWKSSLPAIFRGQVAMALYGNFLESALPGHIAADIGYFPFPKMLSYMPDYEIAPIDVLLITQTTQYPKQSATFLNYVAQPEVQAKLNGKLNQISPNKLSSTMATSPLAKEGTALLKNSAGLSQFFDREVGKALSDAYIQIWVDFIDDPDIDATISKMQQVKDQLRRVKPVQQKPHAELPKNLQ